LAKILVRGEKAAAFEEGEVEFTSFKYCSQVILA
jgi:hypothetical protein